MEFNASQKKAIEAEGSCLLLAPSRLPKGRAYLSYGCDPRGPEGIIVEQSTDLPVIPFDCVEVAL